MTHTIEFEYEKSTKNTHVYSEVQTLTSPLLIGTIYVKKVAFQGTPDKVTVTISNE